MITINTLLKEVNDYLSKLSDCETQDLISTLNDSGIKTRIMIGNGIYLMVTHDNNKGYFLYNGKKAYFPFLNAAISDKKMLIETVRAWKEIKEINLVT